MDSQNTRQRTGLIEDKIYFPGIEKNKTTLKYFSPFMAFIREEKKVYNCCLQSPDPLIQPAKYEHQIVKSEEL